MSTGNLYSSEGNGWRRVVLIALRSRLDLRVSPGLIKGVRSLIGQRIIRIPLIFAAVVICGQFDWSLCQARRGGGLGLRVEWKV